MARLHVGTMGWSYSFWTDSFYPTNTKPAQFLTEYAKHFNTVEVDNTFYRIPSKDTLSKWNAQTPDQFLFSAKFPRKITHQKMLADCEKETDYLTSDFAYVRWEGDRPVVNGTLGKVEVDRSRDIETWANALKRLMDKDIQTFGYFSKYFSGHPPTDAKTLLRKLEFRPPVS